MADDKMNYSTTVLLYTKNNLVNMPDNKSCYGFNIVSSVTNISKCRIEGRLVCIIDAHPQNENAENLCRALRQSLKTAHCYIVSILDPMLPDASGKRAAAGCDDALIGPLTFELIKNYIAKLTAERPWAGVGPTLRVGELEVDQLAYRVLFKGKFIRLSASEFEMLVKLLKNSDTLLTRSHLIGLCRPGGCNVLERSFDNSIRRLRKSLQSQGVPDPVRRIRARGYVIDSGVFGRQAASVRAYC